MKKQLSVVSLLGILLLNSCATFSPQKTCSHCTGYWQSRVSSQDGVTHARKDLKNGFKVMRYDMPSVRSGSWQKYNSYYKHFGIKESGAVFEPLVFMKAYNAEMDLALVKKYGKEYLKYRSKIMPPKDAQKYKLHN